MKVTFRDFSDQIMEKEICQALRLGLQKFEERFIAWEAKFADVATTSQSGSIPGIPGPEQYQVSKSQRIVLLSRLGSKGDEMRGTCILNVCLKASFSSVDLLDLDKDRELPYRSLSHCHLLLYQNTGRLLTESCQIGPFYLPPHPWHTTGAETTAELI
ncbi:hypothetical protein CC80DRAFT_311824 [Byssothecium circinans]|uniref:Uncharacterized protein n=1 Tax=Byssothecium circinans TaxID=147558 RepID=A0A6A5U4Q2_9PLEO|nr:hypothetical protein CC80DRAFT_311824 [Byssothecium circinans]